MNKLAALFCIDGINNNEIIVSINSFVSFHKDTDIIIASGSDLDIKVKSFIDTISNRKIMIPFVQDVSEELMVAKSLDMMLDTDYSRVIYLRSTTVVRKGLDKLFSADMGDCIWSAANEYIYKGTENAKKLYSKEDPNFNLKVEKYGDNFINSDVILFNLKMLRRSSINLTNLYDRMFKHEYFIKPCLSEFMMYLSKDQTTASLNRELNDFGDKHLMNVRAYNRLIRSNVVFSNASIMNFSECKPWLNSLKLSRDTVQYPVQVYKDYLLGLEEFLDDNFIDNVNTNSDKWVRRLGKLPETFFKYYGG